VFDTERSEMKVALLKIIIKII